MQQFATLILGFVLTALVGNRLLQQWQYRSWVRQQQFLGKEKEYLALRQLSEELSVESGSRLNLMRRALAGVSRFAGEEFERRVKEYDAGVSRWNEKLPSFLVRLTFYSTYYRATKLEDSLHAEFVAAGVELEKIIRQKRDGALIQSAIINGVEHTLNRLHHHVFEFNRDLLNAVERLRVETYHGEAIGYSIENLEKFSSTQLVQLLFHRDVDTLAVGGPAGHTL